jgi:hypothetical protein
MNSVGSNGPVLPDEEAVLRPLFAEPHVRAERSAVSQTADAMALGLFGTARQSWATDLSPLRERPPVEFAPGQHACPDHEVLHRCL